MELIRANPAVAETEALPVLRSYLINQPLSPNPLMSPNSVLSALRPLSDSPHISHTARPDHIATLFFVCLPDDRESQKNMKSKNKCLCNYVPRHLSIRPLILSAGSDFYISKKIKKRSKAPMRSSR